MSHKPIKEISSAVREKEEKAADEFAISKKALAVEKKEFAENQIKFESEKREFEKTRKKK